MCKIENDWHKADENKVGASNNAQKECSLSKFGTTQDHLEEDLRIKREQCHDWNGFAIGSIDSRTEETRDLSTCRYLAHNLLDLDIVASTQIHTLCQMLESAECYIL